ncbi:MAG: STAS domain-containing protein [Ruminococcaceae bacterium]|nr:STAS domain-containing protein [Oscillospiraceae bacterium]
MVVETQYEDNILTAKLYGEIDHHQAPMIRNKIDGQTESLRPKELHLDFSGVSFMDSSGIGLIMGRYRQVSLIGGSLKVINVPKRLQKIIGLSGIDTLGVLK